MNRIPHLALDQVTPEVLATLNAVKAKIGMIPNLFSTFAHAHENQSEPEIDTEGTQPDGPQQIGSSMRPPMVQEREAHALTHIPFQAWCPICVRTEARDADHPRRVPLGAGVEAVDERPVVEADYTMMSSFTMLAFYSPMLHVGMATVVTAKGPIDFAVSWFVAKLQMLSLRARCRAGHGSPCA
jgi:hypothetical protein